MVNKKMELFGYPLAIGAGTIFMANRYLYKKYFNPAKLSNPFKFALSKNAEFRAKSWFLSNRRFMQNRSF